MRRWVRAATLLAVAASFGCNAKRSEIIAFTDVPKFREFEGKTYFVVSNDGQEYRVFWSFWRHPAAPTYPSHFKPVALREGQPYRFTFAFKDNTEESADFHATVTPAGAPVSERFMPLGEHRFATLIKIENGPRVVFDQDVCPVHHRRMEVRSAPRVAGVIVAEEIATNCPHHGRFVLGGCLFDDHKRFPALVCSECAAAYDRFEARYFIARVIWFVRSHFGNAGATAAQARSLQNSMR